MSATLCLGSPSALRASPSFSPAAGAGLLARARMAASRTSRSLSAAAEAIASTTFLMADSLELAEQPDPGAGRRLGRRRDLRRHQRTDFLPQFVLAARTGSEADFLPPLLGILEPLLRPHPRQQLIQRLLEVRVLRVGCDPAAGGRDHHAGRQIIHRRTYIERLLIISGILEYLE